MSSLNAVPDAAKLLGALHAVARASGNRAVLEAARAVETAYEALEVERSALANRLHETLVRAEHEASKVLLLRRVAEAVHSSLELEVVLRRVLDIAVDVFSSQRGFVMTKNARDGTVRLAAMHGFDPATLDSDEMQRLSAVAQRIFDSSAPIVSADTQNDPSGVAANLRALSITCIPLISDARTIAVVYLDSPVAGGLATTAAGGLATTADLSLLLAFSNQAAVALENARLFDDQRSQLAEMVRLEGLQAMVLSSITNGIIIIDANGMISSVNEAAAQTFGIDASSMTGRPAAVLKALVPRLPELLERGNFVGPAFEVQALNAVRGKLMLQIRIAPLDPSDDRESAKRSVAIAITDLTERRALETMRRTDLEQRQAIGDAFSRYLAPHVVASLMKAPAALELGGERRTATILFADIRDFTKMAARLEAERVVEILNAYFEAAVSVLFENDGLLDKFYGDGLMAVFGPPRVRADDAARALRSAARLHQVVRDLEPDIGEPLRISVGLATGEVVAGHIGSTRRLDYTVIGDAVNLASRLQSAAPPSATYCDETTYVRSGLHLPGERLQAKIKGREELVTVYRLT